MKSLSVTIQMKATEQYFPMVQSIMLYKVVLTFDSVDKIPVCNYSNETELLSTRIPSCFCLLRSTRWFWKYKKCDQNWTYQISAFLPYPSPLMTSGAIQ